ncbi:MAG: PTS sugar transporter subunit IIA [Phycisphaerae bacterium]
MPYRSMSLEEFARFVGMDPRQVQREANHGNLPGRRVGGQWRFNMIQVHDWLQSRMLTLPDDRLATLDRSIGSATQAGASRVTDLIGAEGIELQMAASTKTSVLRELVNLADRTQLLYDGKELFEALRTREAAGSTALPGGLAIPHPAQPLPYATAEPLVCIGRVVHPVGFGAPDGAMTQLFFLICSHESQAHLHVLARLMRMLQDDDTVESLRTLDDAAEVLQLLIERERAVADSLK